MAKARAKKATAKKRAATKESKATKKTTEKGPAKKRAATRTPGKPATAKRPDKKHATAKRPDKKHATEKRPDKKHAADKKHATEKRPDKKHATEKKHATAKRPDKKHATEKRPDKKHAAEKRPAAKPATTFDVDAFWALIGRVDAAARGDLTTARVAFRAELEALDDASVIEAEGIFSDLMRRAHDWGLWGAAYVIQGGCSDDGFWDFRAGLIALGKPIYEEALRDPDSLAAVEDIARRTLAEGFQYIPRQVLEARGLVSSGRGHHARPVHGVAWEDDQLPTRFPRLTTRFD